MFGFDFIFNFFSSILFYLYFLLETKHSLKFVRKLRDCLVLFLKLFSIKKKSMFENLFVTKNSKNILLKPKTILKNRNQTN